jgi:hypothetical protein
VPVGSQLFVALAGRANRPMSALGQKRTLRRPTKKPQEGLGLLIIGGGRNNTLTLNAIPAIPSLFRRDRGSGKPDHRNSDRSWDDIIQD